MNVIAKPMPNIITIDIDVIFKKKQESRIKMQDKKKERLE